MATGVRKCCRAISSHTAWRSSAPARFTPSASVQSGAAGPASPPPSQHSQVGSAQSNTSPSAGMASRSRRIFTVACSFCWSGILQLGWESFRYVCVNVVVRLPPFLTLTTCRNASRFPARDWRAREQSFSMNSKEWAHSFYPSAWGSTRKKQFLSLI